MGTISDLNAFTTYSCTVHAVTVAEGPGSNAVTVMTDEIRMINNHAVILNYTVTGINSSVIRVTWSQPTMPNGIITSYTVSVSNSEIGTVLYNGQDVSNPCIILYHLNIMVHCNRHNLMTLLDYLLINWSQ